MTPLEFEAEQQEFEKPHTVELNSWVVQGVIYELITNYFINSPPSERGYPLPFKFDPADKLKSDVIIETAYTYSAATTAKKPGIFISRGDNSVAGRTMGHSVGIDPASSQVQRLLMNQMQVRISVVAAPVATAELLADYLKQLFATFQQEIQYDFKFRKFRLVEVSRPQLVTEGKEYFVVSLTLDIAYDDNTVVQRDDLKLKTIGLFLFDAVAAQLAAGPDVAIPPSSLSEGGDDGVLRWQDIAGLEEVLNEKVSSSTITNIEVVGQLPQDPHPTTLYVVV